MISAAKVVLSALGLSLVLASVAVAAPTHTFSQTISLIDCTETAVSSGQGQVHDVRCDDAIMPTVVEQETDNPRPIIHGTYDATSAKMLRVFVGGRWYVLGEDAALTADGDNWQLDLSGQPKLPVGDHNVTVEVVTTESLLLRDLTDNELVILAPPPDENDDDEGGTIDDSDGGGGPGIIGSIIPKTPNTAGEWVAYIQRLGTIVATLLAVCGLGFVGLRRHREKKKYQQSGQQWYNKR